jgi:hypothetical protein
MSRSRRRQSQTLAVPSADALMTKGAPGEAAKRVINLQCIGRVGQCHGTNRSTQQSCMRSGALAACSHFLCSARWAIATPRGYHGAGGEAGSSGTTPLVLAGNPSCPAVVSCVVARCGGRCAWTPSACDAASCERSSASPKSAGRATMRWAPANKGAAPRWGPPPRGAL